ncbi:hypothetical protein ACKI14_02800 [Streptomyces turgidiscabies]|uniref:hypothetical protein n=1 Tax=Streptomyces turgidiscabies TaxID=85558 RepID=UPI0038F817CB
MTRTGPQKIPGASQAHFYGDGQYSGSDLEVNCGVVHTTEGRTLPDYNGGAIAPTVTGVPDIAARRIRWYQHYDVDESARALANKLGGVETNTSNAFQVELVGTCDDSKKTSWGSARAGVDYLHWPTAPEWALAELAWLLRWLNANHGVPLTCAKDWLAYGTDARRPGVTPASYGANPARMTFTQWNAFTGWCGHQHVPENDHGDPGSLDFARVIALAKGTTTQEDDMPTPQEYAKAVWDYKLTSPTAAEGTDPTRQAGVFLAYTDAKQKQLLSQLAELKAIEAAQNATIDKLVGAVATLAANIGDLDPAAIVAELRASIESITIHLDVPEA